MPLFGDKKKKKKEKSVEQKAPTTLPLTEPETVMSSERILPKEFIQKYESITGDLESLGEIHQKFLLDLPGYKERINRYTQRGKEISPVFVFLAVNQVIIDFSKDRFSPPDKKKFSESDAVAIYEVLAYGKKLEGRERFRHNSVERRSLADDMSFNCELAFGDDLGRGPIVNLFKDLQRKAIGLVPKLSYFESYHPSLEEEYKELLEDGYMPVFNPAAEGFFELVVRSQLSGDTVNSHLVEIDVDTGRESGLPVPTKLVKLNVGRNEWTPSIDFRNEAAHRSAFYGALANISEEALTRLSESSIGVDSPTDSGIFSPPPTPKGNVEASAEVHLRSNASQIRSRRDKAKDGLPLNTLDEASFAKPQGREKDRRESPEL